MSLKHGRPVSQTGFGADRSPLPHWSPCSSYTCFFFVSNTFISNARLKLTKNKSKAKQHPESELLLFDNYRFSSSTLSSFNNKRCSKNCTKNKWVCINEVIWLTTIKMRLQLKNRSHRYGINRPRLRNGDKYAKYKMCLSTMMVICLKQHLSNIWSSIH